jgi:hypothetical protein
LTANFTLTVNYTGGGSPAVIPITVPIGPAPFTITTTLDGVAPSTVPAGGTATTGLQTSRLTRNGVASACSPPKANPGLLSGGSGTRQFDLYTFNSCPSAVASCATVTVTQPGTIPLFTVGYAPTLNPANPSANYAGDPGVSAASMSYAFPLSGGGAGFAVTVHEVNSGVGLGTSYTLTVSGACGGACATPNAVPVAIAQNVTVRTHTGFANVSINNGSSDPNGDPLTITQTPPGPYPLGMTTVLLTVTDPSGATSQATGVVTVQFGTPKGDFDSDGKDDLLWRNKVTGQNIGFLMNGLTVANSAFLPTIADTNW